MEEIRVTIKESRRFLQLGILVLDGSGSMTDVCSGGLQKDQAVNNAVKEFLQRMKASSNVKNFMISIIKFSDTAILINEPIEIEKIDANANYTPTIDLGGGTSIFSGLELAEKYANNFLNSVDSGAPKSVAIVILSDGMSSDPQKVKDKANEIKSNYQNKVSIACTFFRGLKSDLNEETNGKELLKSIISDPKNFNDSYDGAQIRDFFIKSMTII